MKQHGAPRLVQAFAHIPLVEIAGRDAVVGEGELVHLRFEEWKQLDSGFPFADRAYERSRPLFYQVDFGVGDAADGPTFDDVRAHGESLAELLYRAIVLVTAERIPSPAFSVAYYVDSHSGAFQTTVGPFEREVVLYAPEWRLSLGDDALDRVRAAVDFLAERADLVTIPEVEAAFQTLERTARPEITALSALAHEVVALESLLMPEARTKLTATFSRRAAALLASTPEEVRTLHRRARRWYQARSEILHGGDYQGVIADVEKDQDAFAFDVRRGLVASVGAVLAILTARPGNGLEGLRAELDTAFQSDAAFARLHARAG